MIADSLRRWRGHSGAPIVRSDAALYSLERKRPTSGSAGPLRGFAGEVRYQARAGGLTYRVRVEGWL